MNEFDSIRDEGAMGDDWPSVIRDENSRIHGAGCGINNGFSGG